MPKKIKQEQIEKMVEMYEQGYSMAEIGRLLKLSRNTVSKYLREEGKEPIELESEMEGDEKEEDVGVSSIEPIGLLPFELQKRIWLTSDEYGVPLEDVADQVLGLVRFCTYEQIEFSELLNVVDFLQQHRKTIRSKSLNLKDFCSEIKSIKLLKQLIKGKQEELRRLENTKNMIIRMAVEKGRTEMSQEVIDQAMRMKMFEALQRQGQQQPEEREEEAEEKEPIISNPFEKLLATVPREKTKSPKRFKMRVVPPSEEISKARFKRYPKEVEEPVSRLSNPIERARREAIEREKEPATRLRNVKEEATKYAEPFREKPEPSPLTVERIDEPYLEEQRKNEREKSLESYRQTPFDNLGDLVIRRRLAEPKPLFSERHPRFRVKERRVDDMKVIEFEAEEPTGKVFDIFEHGTHKSIREFE